MKKFLTALTTALLVVILALAMTGCGKADAIKSAYEKDGYTVSTTTVKDNDEAKTVLKTVFGMTDDDVKEAENWEVIVATKGALGVSGSAVILKFPSSGELKDFLTTEKDGEKDTSVYDKAVENGSINGECLLLVGLGGARDVFKKA